MPGMMPTRTVGLGPDAGGTYMPVTQPTWGQSPPKPPTGNPLPVKGGPMKGPGTEGTQGGPGNILGAQAVRASGSGPFDPAYRQNLATYGGGMFQRPGGMLSLNPTSQTPFTGMGAATGGGNAPIYGAPTDMLTGALGGQAYQTPQPAPAPTSPTSTFTSRYPWLNSGWQQWLNGLQQQGGMLRGF